MKYNAYIYVTYRAYKYKQCVNVGITTINIIILELV